MFGFERGQVSRATASGGPLHGGSNSARLHGAIAAARARQKEKASACADGEVCWPPPDQGYTLSERPAPPLTIGGRTPHGGRRLRQGGGGATYFFLLRLFSFGTSLSSAEHKTAIIGWLQAPSTPPHGSRWCPCPSVVGDAAIPMLTAIPRFVLAVPTASGAPPPPMTFLGGFSLASMTGPSSLHPRMALLPMGAPRWLLFPTSDRHRPSMALLPTSDVDLRHLWLSW